MPASLIEAFAAPYSFRTGTESLRNPDWPGYQAPPQQQEPQSIFGSCVPPPPPPPGQYGGTLDVAVPMRCRSNVPRDAGTNTLDDDTKCDLHIYHIRITKTLPTTNTQRTNANVIRTNTNPNPNPKSNLHPNANH
jgi:hypothetical protein